MLSLTEPGKCLTKQVQMAYETGEIAREPEKVGYEAAELHRVAMP